MSQQSAPVTTMKEARVVIEELAMRKGTFTEAFRRKAEQEAENGSRHLLQTIEGGEELREDLSEALGIISKDLYTNRARFLMEVIQNADDNKYDEGKTPTITVTVFPEYVKIECNEKGFSRENIQALCRTGRSSKPPGQGYTGEKGIGFKSVFKLAKQAHIRSFPYYFQLDQTRELGMITPLWDKDFFDDHEEDYQTTIILDRIYNQSTDFSAALQKAMDAIDPILILFLRRIERIHLTLYKSSADDKPTLSKRFKCHTWTEGSGIVAFKDEDAKRNHRFYKLQYWIDFEGTETRRPNIIQTEIVLAFPVTWQSGTHKPKVQRQNAAFAYLPLGNFGFKFVIQADFLTTSNRQSVDEDNDWNDNIADAIPHAFEQAIYNFNEEFFSSGDLAKTWPLYLSNTAGGLSTYWQNIAKGIRKQLRGASIIETRSGLYNAPENLMFLDWAHNRKGEPIFGSDDDYISPNYPDSVRQPLSSIGITEPDWLWVCDKLQELLKEGKLHTKERTAAWYSDLAKVILKPQEPRDDRKYARDLKKIPLIPLADGPWRRPPSDQDPIYFPASLGVTIPPGLKLSLVEAKACACPKRTKLFRLLGVKDCEVADVVKRILDYHSKLDVIGGPDLIAQVKYLYRGRKHLRPDGMRNVYFYCGPSRKVSVRGNFLYVDTSVRGELKQLFSGYSEAYFPDPCLFEDFDPDEKAEFVAWLQDSASVASMPRFASSFSSGLHEDFVWLLNNRLDQVLNVLHKYWSSYKSCMTEEMKEALAAKRFKCKSGARVALRETFLPLRPLVEKCQAFCNADKCYFLDVPNGTPAAWTFLSSLSVGIHEDLDFYLWLLKQPGYKGHADVFKAKKLYIEIQSRAFSPAEQKKVRHAFANKSIALPNGEFTSLICCVYQGPPGFLSRPVLRSIYGAELARLFQQILKVPNATSDDVLAYLEELSEEDSTSMADVVGIYVYLQRYQANRIDAGTVCIAIPSSGSGLQWMTPSQCVWDDAEFSENELELESKYTIRRVVEQHMPTAKAFFTSVLGLPDAGIIELLADLGLMRQENRDNPNRVYHLYERIESRRRRSASTIKEHFKKAPLVFLRGINDERGQWLSLDDCIWTRSVLRNKHALMPTLNQYRDLFRDTLEVTNATTDTLVTELLKITSKKHAAQDDDKFEYSKKLLREIARLGPYEVAVYPLCRKKCWPCHTPTGPRRFCSIGSFFVNDRQDLFDVFSRAHTFLDFDFDASQEVADLLRNASCDNFLSMKVSVDTEESEPLDPDYDLTQDFRSRADAIVKYFEHVECDSPDELRPFLENVMFWTSADIKTHYELDGILVTNSDGGSCVRATGPTSENGAQLDIYVSANKLYRDCALMTDLPEQLMVALCRESTDVSDLHLILQVPLASLNALLIKKGIIGSAPAEDHEGISVADSTDENSQSRLDSSSDDSDDGALTTSTSSARSDSTSSNVVKSISASARIGVTSSTMRPHITHRPIHRPATPVSESQSRLGAASGASPLERPVTPRPTPTAAGGLYGTNNRSRNRERLVGFARSADPASSSRAGRSSRKSGGDGGEAFDMGSLRDTLDIVAQPAPVSTPVHNEPSSRRRAGPIPNRNEDEMARDFEVGFLGEQFVYNLLHDKLELPDFSGETNWTSSLRTRAGFSAFGREVSDFTYKDTHGALTYHFLQMQHPYSTPAWLSTSYDNGNAPLYRLEVKSTTSQDPTTTFYMSRGQHKLAKNLRVTIETPSEIYVILRISGLDALEDGAGHRPQWRVYLDPYSRGEEGVLNFAAPMYAVTATA